ncbi:hypothetical protein GGI35DRAFT_218854 [Trichoderma velutinum]
MRFVLIKYQYNEHIGLKWSVALALIAICCSQVCKTAIVVLSNQISPRLYYERLVTICDERMRHLIPDALVPPYLYVLFPLEILYPTLTFCAQFNQ